MTTRVRVKSGKYKGKQGKIVKAAYLAKRNILFTVKMDGGGVQRVFF